MLTITIVVLSWFIIGIAFGILGDYVFEENTQVKDIFFYAFLGWCMPIVFIVFFLTDSRITNKTIFRFKKH